MPVSLALPAQVEEGVLLFSLGFYERAAPRLVVVAGWEWYLASVRFWSDVRGVEEAGKHGAMPAPPFRFSFGSFLQQRAKP